MAILIPEILDLLLTKDAGCLWKLVDQKLDPVYEQRYATYWKIWPFVKKQAMFQAGFLVGMGAGQCCLPTLWFWNSIGHSTACTHTGQALVTSLCCLFVHPNSEIETLIGLFIGICLL